MEEDENNFPKKTISQDKSRFPFPLKKSGSQGWKLKKSLNLSA